MFTFIKYPRTPHLVGSRLQPGDDTVGQVDLASLTGGEFVWEEKIDGANAAVSFSSEGRLMLQSRGHVLTGGAREGQFSLFKAWASCHEQVFLDLLGTRYVMYGEWCFAKHTVFYDRLPHYFLEFDIFDRERQSFLATDERHALLAGSPVISVPVVHRGRLTTEKQVRQLIRPSLYKSADWEESLRVSALEAGIDPDEAGRQTEQSSLSEGLYLKHESGGAVVGRYKYVRADFLQAIAESGSHWAERPLLPNRLADGVDLFSGEVS